MPLVLLAGCSLFQRQPVRPPVAEAVHYEVGAPYQAGGTWRYPHAEYGFDRTGLATIAPDRTGLTADGEIYDATMLTAGHPSLQLPAIARVTNLENGRSVLVRLNDRGPERPSRMLALTPRAATLLGAHDATMIRLQIQDAESRQLAAELDGGGPALDVAGVPRGSVQAESLAPPTGAGASNRGRVAGPAPKIMYATAGSAAAVPRRLPELVSQGAPGPSGLYIDAGTFSRADYATILVRQLQPLGARLTTSYTASRDKAYRIRIGPLANIAESEAMLQRAISAGVNDAAIVVE